MELNLNVGESVTVRGSGVPGSLIINNTGVSLHVNGYDHGLLRQLVQYPECLPSRQPRELGPALTEPFSTPLEETDRLNQSRATPELDKLVKEFDFSGATTLQLKPGNRELPLRASITTPKITSYPLADQNIVQIAEELFDMLFDLQLAIREGDPRMQGLTEQAAELLDRVETQVKGK